MSLLFRILVLICFKLVCHQILWVDAQHSNYTEWQHRGSEDCVLTSHCGPNERCVEGICECKADYHNISGSCAEFTCTKDSMCYRTFDQHRVCDKTCICDDGYKEDPYSLVCDEKCNTTTTCKDSNSYCYYGECICVPGYRKDVYGICQSAVCDDSTDCFWRLHDFNTHCVSGQCICNDKYQMNTSTDMCTEEMSPWVWAWVFFVVPFAIILAVILYLRRQRAVKKAIDIPVHTMS